MASADTVFIVWIGSKSISHWEKWVQPYISNFHTVIKDIYR